jgi:predicted Zn-dependent protease with MMP-like domain
MTRDQFQRVAEQELATLPAQYRERVQNVAIVIEDYPAEDGPPEDRDPDDLLMGIFDGVPLTERSFFAAEPGPARVILYQSNIEAYAQAIAADEGRPVEEVIREEVRLTLLHELGHYFGLDEDELEDV